MEMNQEQLHRYLQDLEDRIDPAEEERLYKAWLDFWQDDNDDDLFMPQRQSKRPPAIEWPDSPINQLFSKNSSARLPLNATFEDYNLMALQQLKTCSDALAAGSGYLLCVRSNYGTAILPSLFDADLFFMEEKLNTLPTSKPFKQGRQAIEKIIDKGLPDINTALGKKTLDMTAMFKDLFRHYPKIRKTVSIYHPDCQGPMDCVELLYGSQLFLDIIEHPDLVKSLLRLCTDTYIAFMTKWLQIVPQQNLYTVHWGMLQKGNIMLRDDSAMNFSPQMFVEFIRPYDEELLQTFNGGCVHFCGRGDHYIEKMSKMSDLYGINLSQPECNNMDVIFNNTIDKGLKILGLKEATARKVLDDGRDLKRNVHSFADTD